ncbi:AsmA-like C-terminal region-containing protein [Roseococcus sp. YIM B11640]|uniref:YhdP family protein n=1 Tax=Roseococcus sp. YIM B11640 TaxID=3133973 RepID=UPI003C7C494C
MSEGQAPRRRHLPRLAGLLCSLVIALPLLGGLALGALAWRLARGPIEWSFIARQIENAGNRVDPQMRVSVARASIAWEGWRGGRAPLQIRLEEVVLRDAEGTSHVTLPEAGVTLAFAPLLRGMLAPASVELRNPSIELARDAEGGLALGPGAAGRAPGGAEVTGEGGRNILADLMRPADEAAAHTSIRSIRITGGRVLVRDRFIGRDWSLEGTHIELRRLGDGGVEGDGEAVMRMGEVALPVHLTGNVRDEPMRFGVRLDLPVLRPSELAPLLPNLRPFSVLDAPIAIQARAEFDAAGRPASFGLDLQSPEGGTLRLTDRSSLPFERLSANLEGDGERIVLNQARIELPGGDRTSLEGSGQLARREGGWAGEVRFDLQRLELAGLARLWPVGIADEVRAKALDAIRGGRVGDAVLRVDAVSDATLTQWSLPAMRLEGAIADALFMTPAGVAIPVSGIDVAMRAGPEQLKVENLVLSLAAPGGGEPARVTARGQADLDGGRWRAAIDLGLDRARFADLPILWPRGIGEGARYWITENITAGEASAGRWQIALEAPEDLSRIEVGRFAGELEVQGATVHWLRPVPPMRGVAGRVNFGLEEITVQASAGRQENANGQPGALEVRGADLRFLLPQAGQDRTEMSFNLAGPLAEVVQVLRHPRLHLFDKRPFPAQVAAGQFEGRLNIGFPMVANLQMEQVRLRAEARASHARLTRLLFEKDLEDANIDLVTDTEQLRLSGTASMVGVPLRLGVEMDFRPGPANQVTSRETVTARPEPRHLSQLGFEVGALASGPIALDVRTERRRNGQGTVAVRADLRDAVLAFSPLQWIKPDGSPGQAEATVRLQGDTLTGIDNIRLEALELALRARAVARAGRIERVELQETSFGASRLTGDARAPPPANRNAPWTITLRGPVLDLRSVFGTGSQVSGGGARSRGVEIEAPEGTQPPLLLDMRFDQVLLGPERELYAAQMRGRIDRNGVVRDASMRGRTARQAGAFEMALTPRGEARHLRGTAEDGGTLLRAFGIIETIQGGRLSVDAEYPEARPGAPLTGSAELQNFTVRNAPVLGKVLQAMTLFGVVDALQGGRGLQFSRAVVPFTLTQEALRINEARAFSSSLGLTARGRVMRERVILDMEGTIVPAYFFNTLLGNLPLVGRLFSPETGGGVFAATFRVQGPPEDAQVTVNPLAALTPGFLRGLFGLADSTPPAR